MDADMYFYFLEMNTRLQVEHPVTECITGIDLVEQQIRIARGESLGFAQEDLDIRGHAVELRIYAEDPLQNFMPGTGTLTTYQKPEGPGIRVDDGFGEGMQVPVYYDPLLSKLITHGRTREEAIQLMIDAIGRYTVRGVATTLPFGKFVCEHPAFRSGDFDTHFVQKYYSPELLEIQHFTERTIAARMGLHLYLEDQKILKTPICTPSNWHKRRMIG
jgi:propionyl-CoA carboxylase alpha chain